MNRVNDDHSQQSNESMDLSDSGMPDEHPECPEHGTRLYTDPAEIHYHRIQMESMFHAIREILSNTHQDFPDFPQFVQSIQQYAQEGAELGDNHLIVISKNMTCILDDYFSEHS